MESKTGYRIRNWTQYNKSLMNRGSITFWFSEDEEKMWKSQKKSEGKGRPEEYSDVAIQCMLVIRAVYHLPLRGLQGFVRSLIALMGFNLSCPNYTTVCKRAKTLKIKLPRLVKPGEGIHVLVDSTGLKIYGEGEWKTRKHGISKRRTWRKFHVGICEKNQSVVGAALTTNDIGDSEVFGSLLDTIDGSIESVSGDGAYDTIDCYDACDCYGANPIIPPRRGAKKQGKNKEESLKKRDQAIEFIKTYGGDDEGRKNWKKEMGYHRRSLAETHFFRHKTIFGSNLRSRLFCNQATEAFAMCAALNKMTSLGMPDSYPVTL